MEDGGYAGVEDVQAMPPKQLDRMETFWLGETLSTSTVQIKRKYIYLSNQFTEYLYLLFDDSDHIPLDSESIFVRGRIVCLLPTTPQKTSSIPRYISFTP